MSQRSRAFGSSVKLVVLLLVTAALVWTILNRSVLADDFRLWQFTPSSDVASLAQKIQFTSAGQRLFYVSHAELDDKQAFNGHCASTEAGVTVLGCYARESIYIYDVSDPRLDGVQEVTAAHETLHAAYARLSTQDKAQVDSMILQEYDKLSGDPAFKKRFSVYDSLSQADKLNELHSIFGTEVASLPSNLESYYNRYFTNRSVIVAYHDQYQKVFTNIKAQQTQLASTIESLKSKIDSEQSDYEAKSQALQADIQTFNTRARSGYYSSQSQMDADRAALVARSNALDSERDAINEDIDTYNNDISQYNSLSTQTQDLNNSLSSTAPAPSI